MTAFVLDTSVAATWCLPDEAGVDTDALQDALAAGRRAVVPALWRWEIANVLARSLRRGRLTLPDFESARLLMDRLPIEIDAECATRALDSTLVLANAHRLTAYDASYLELAIRRRLPLATRDRELAQAASAAGVGLLLA